MKNKNLKRLISLILTVFLISPNLVDFWINQAVANTPSIPVWWSFTINNGKVATSYSIVQLDINCPFADSPPFLVAYWNDPSPTNWTTCNWNTNVAHAINTNWWDWDKNVYVRFKDDNWLYSNDIMQTIKYDLIAPSWWSISYTDWLESGPTMDIWIGASSDNTSWMSDNPNDYLLEMQTWSLSNWNCINYWEWEETYRSENSTKTWYTIITKNMACYKFRYSVKDKAWNITVYDSASETKIISNDPVITTCNLESFENLDYQKVYAWPVLYYNSNFTWSFKINVQAQADWIWIKSINIPNIWTWFSWDWDCLNWNCSRTISWEVWASVNPWNLIATVTSNNNNTAECAFTIINDNLPPSNWTIKYWTAIRNLTTSAPIYVDDGFDTWVWIYTWSRILEVATADLSWWNCQSYSAFSQTWYTGNYFFDALG